MCKRAISLLLLCIFFCQPAQAVCSGRFVNPVTDVCWRCLFPLKIGGVTIPGFDFDNLTEVASQDQVSSPVCYCPTPFPRIGLTLSFWEPVRLFDVTRTPFCFTSLGGLTINPGVPVMGGSVDASTPGENTSTYHVHYYIFPIINFLNLIIDAVCLETQGVDLAWLSELDPTWKSDLLANIIVNPESIIFANPIAQAAAAVDCSAASVNLPLDPMFWTGGCQGSVYPLSGRVGAHVGGVQASLLLMQRMIHKLHRQGMLFGSMGDAGLCGSYPMPVWRKSQYRSQMTYPIPGFSAEPFPCNPMGRASVLYESGREFPIKGEDFAYLLWRKRNCCAL